MHVNEFPQRAAGHPITSLREKSKVTVILFFALSQKKTKKRTEEINTAEMNRAVLCKLKQRATHEDLAVMDARSTMVLL